MRFIFLTLGSFGDVIPPLSIALELKNRGHQVEFCTNGHFKDFVESYEIPFDELTPAKDYERLVHQVDIHNPNEVLKEILHNLILGPIDEVIQLLEGKDLNQMDQVVSYAGNPGAYIFHEKSGVPLTSMCYAPAVIRSAKAPARLGRPGLIKFLPPWVLRMGFQAFDFLVHRGMKDRINPVREKLGLKPTNNCFSHFFSDQRILGLFPEDYIGSIPGDWPEHLKLCGFPFLPKSPQAIEPGLLEFIKTSPRKPILFTPGTPNSKGQNFFEAARFVCEQLDQPAIFSSAHAGQFEVNSSLIYPAGFLPFDEVIPLTSLLVHHGGVGTTARALKYGVPHLIAPWGVDQWDNAARVQALGVGLEVHSGRNLKQDLLRQVQKLLESDTYSKKASLLAQRSNMFLGAQRAADVLEGGSN